MAAIDYRDLPQSELVKVIYGEYQDDQFVTESAYYGMINKEHNFVGKQKEVAVRLSIGAGVGSNILPDASGHDISKAVISRKKLYARQELDNESIEATRDPMGTFASFLKEYDEVTKLAFAVNSERQLIANDILGSGKLAVGSASTANVTGNGSVGTPFVVNLSAATNMFALEVGYLINVNSETTKLKVSKIDPDNKTIELVGASARLTTLVAAPEGLEAADAIYMQNSKDSELEGLNGILRATTGSYKGIDIGYRWQAHQIDATASNTARTKHINNLLTKMMTQLGSGKNKVPNLIMASPTQYYLYETSLETAKQYSFNAADKRFSAQVSYSGIEVLTSSGPIPMIVNRFVPEDTIMFVNTNQITWHDLHAPKWLDRDGTILGRRENADAYEARYGCYVDVLVNPFFQGIIFNLSTTA